MHTGLTLDSFLNRLYSKCIMNSLRIQNKAFANNEVDKTQPPEFSFLMFEQVMNLRHLVFRDGDNTDGILCPNIERIFVKPEDYKNYLKHTIKNPSKLNNSKVFKTIQYYENYKKSIFDKQNMRLMIYITEDMYNDIDQVDCVLIIILASVQDVVECLLNNNITKQVSDTDNDLTP